MSKRADALRKETQDELREKIKGAGALGKVLANLEKMETLAEIDHIPPAEDAEGGKPIDPSTQIHNLQIVNNGYLKLLNKVLPDLKATDMHIQGDLKLVAIDMTGLDDDGESSEADD